MTVKDNQTQIDETKDVTFASRGQNADPVDTGDAHGNRMADVTARKDDMKTVNPSVVPGQRVTAAKPVETGNPHANRKADVPSTDKPKSQLMKEAIALLSTMDGESLSDLITSRTVAEDAPVVDDIAKVVSEDLKEVFGSAQLSEEFTNRALVIFEAAVGAKVSSRIAELDEEYNQKLDEATAAIEENLVNVVDKFLSFVAEEWKEENRVALEEGIRKELSESFISGLKGLFESHYVSIPEDKVDVLESTKSDLDETEAKLNNVTKELIEAQQEIASFKKKAIVEELSTGLTMPERDRFVSLTESIDTSDVEDFRSKVTILRESVSTTTTPSSKSDNTLDEEVKIVESTKKPVSVYKSPWLTTDK